MFEEILIKAISDPLINDLNFSLSELLSGGRLRPVDRGVRVRPDFPEVAMLWDMTQTRQGFSQKSGESEQVERSIERRKE